MAKPIWIQWLDDATPGNYGIWDLELDAPITNIRVNMREKTFRFWNAKLSFLAQLFSSSDGVEVGCAVTVSGIGTFEFGPERVIRVTGFEITNHPIDLFDYIRPRRKQFVA
jgi:hypothetical protein